jgi:sulfate transport system substrate-binding protein
MESQNINNLKTGDFMKLKQLSIILFFSAIFVSGAALAERTILNVSYDPTRELYQQFNKLFIKYWKDKSGEDIRVQQSHGGGGKQTRAVIDGLEADVVTLALSGDIDQIAERARVLPKDWQSKLPNNSLPYTSTMVFVVRKGNSKQIKNWDDLVKEGVSVVTPNPKTSGGARYNYLAAWAFALKKFGNEDAAIDFEKKLFKNVAVLDSGARGATTTFAEREIGDVLLTWENEAYLVLKEFGQDKFDIIVPPFSILAEPPVAVIEKVATKNGNLDLATEYLKYLYSKPAQDIIAQNYYRPSDKETLSKYAKQFPSIELVTIASLGGWAEVQNKHFADGGVFDKIYER